MKEVSIIFTSIGLIIFFLPLLKSDLDNQIKAQCSLWGLIYFMLGVSLCVYWWLS